MIVAAFLHDLFVMTCGVFPFLWVCFTCAHSVLPLSWIARNMHVVKIGFACFLCVTVGAAPSRECARLGAACRHTLRRRASPHSSSHSTPSCLRAQPSLSRKATTGSRHSLNSPSPRSGPLRIPRPSPDGRAECAVGVWGRRGRGGRVAGHGHICSRTGWGSRGSGETEECAGPHRAFYCECWEMAEQRGGGGRGCRGEQGSPRALHRLNKVSLRKPPDQMCPQDRIVLCSVVIIQSTVKKSCEWMTSALRHVR